MRKLVYLIVFACLLAGQTAHSCTVPPNYLPGEYGSDDIALGNIVERADKIVFGAFTKEGSTNSIEFQVSKYLKPRTSFFSPKVLTVSYSKVKQFHFISGEDKNSFRSEEEIFKFVEVLNALKNQSGRQFGVGGPIAGIYHGSDCERDVVTFSNQKYLVFLDVGNSAIARFAINQHFEGKFGNLVRSINEALEESSQ